MPVFRLQFYPLLILAIVFCDLLAAQSQEKEKDTLQGWQKTRAEIFERVEQEVKDKVEDTITLENVAARINIKLPVKEIKKTADEIFAETRQEAREEALAAKPLKELQVIVHEAERIYPLYEIGDQVSIRTRIKAYPMATGIVMGISDERIRIGSRWIPVRDIAEEQRNGFDKFKTENLRRNFIARQNNLQMAILQNTTNDLFMKKLPANLREAGYFAESDEQQELLKPENWISTKAFLQAELTRLQKEEAARLRPAIEKRLFTENKFKYYEDKKEWRPAGIFQNLKNLFE